MMRKLMVLTIIGMFLGFLILASSIALAGPIAKCTTIKDGGLTDSLGNPLETGFDQFGYNYQAHEFNGTYDSADRKFDGMYYGQSGDFVDDNFSMKWSDDWLSNQDCNGDGKLDRGAPGSSGYPNTSQGWLTNHVEGDYIDADGNPQHYTYFVKFVWVGPCKGEEGCVWDYYKIIQEVYNDPAGGLHGVKPKVSAPGLGLNDQWTQY